MSLCYLVGSPNNSREIKIKLLQNKETIKILISSLLNTTHSYSVLIKFAFMHLVRNLNGCCDCEEKKEEEEEEGEKSGKEKKDEMVEKDRLEEKGEMMEKIKATEKDWVGMKKLVSNDKTNNMDDSNNYSNNNNEIIFVMDDGKKIKSNKERVSRSSRVFQVMVEGTFRESKENIIPIRNISSLAFELLNRAILENKMDDEVLGEWVDDGDVMVNLLLACHQYLLLPFQLLLISLLCRNISSHFNKIINSEVLLIEPILPFHCLLHASRHLEDHRAVRIIDSLINYIPREFLVDRMFQLIKMNI